MPATPTVRRLRSGAAALGAAALLVGGLNVASDAAGAAKPLLLGKSNKATKTTKLSVKKGPALSLKSKKGPALAVNNTDLVKNLNADSVDGKGLDQLEPTTQVFNLGAAGQAGSGSAVAFQTTTLPSGNYEFNIHGLVALNTGDAAECAVLDVTRFIASGGADYTSVYALADQTDGSGANLDSHGIGPVVTGNRVAFLCFWSTTSTLLTPVQFTVKRLDRIGAVPNVGATTFPKAAAAKLRP